MNRSTAVEVLLANFRSVPVFVNRKLWTYIPHPHLPSIPSIYQINNQQLGKKDW